MTLSSASGVAILETNSCSVGVRDVARVHFRSCFGWAWSAGRSWMEDAGFFSLWRERERGEINIRHFQEDNSWRLSAVKRDVITSTKSRFIKW